MRFTNFKIKNLPIGKRVHDGRGLYLTLSSPGRGKWTSRYMLTKKAKEMGLGQYPEVSPAEARKRNFASLIQVADSIDPVEMKKKATILAKREASLFFSQVEDDYIKEHGDR